MMNRCALLGQCRLALAAVRAQQRVVGDLQTAAALTADAVMQAAWERRLLDACETLEAVRRHYDTLYPVALAALDGLDGRAYDVLWRFYLFGQTIPQIAAARGESTRTISRAKAAGLKALEVYHE